MKKKSSPGRKKPGQVQERHPPDHQHGVLYGPLPRPEHPHLARPHRVQRIVGILAAREAAVIEDDRVVLVPRDRLALECIGDVFSRLGDRARGAPVVENRLGRFQVECESLPGERVGLSAARERIGHVTLGADGFSGLVVRDRGSLDHLQGGIRLVADLDDHVAAQEHVFLVHIGDGVVLGLSRGTHRDGALRRGLGGRQGDLEMLGKACLQVAP